MNDIRTRIRMAGLGGFLVLVALLAACGIGTGPEPAEIAVTPRTALIVGVDATASFSATVRDGSGTIKSGRTVIWSTGDPGIASIDSTGTAAGVSAGTTTVTATADGATGTAMLEVYVPETVATYEPGRTYTGRADYIEYTPGTLPIILSAGHGGDREPDEIPDRTRGTTITDLYTMELTRAVEEALIARTGGQPHVITSRLDRAKLDPNREIVEAAQGNPYAELAWEEYHGYIDDAAELVTVDHGAGLYLDMHGHGHEILRLELGYLLSGAALGLSDAQLDSRGYADDSSIAALAAAVDVSFSALLRGEMSLGALLSDRGVRAVPSDEEPAPDGDPYFTGGYSTRRHGSWNGGTVSGIQIEHHRVGLRDTQANREAYAAVLAEVLEVYLAEHYGLEITSQSVPASQTRQTAR
ncbi:MAG: Ig-like domain-containing protein [Longimicrobiales bacterium]